MDTYSFPLELAKQNIKIIQNILIKSHKHSNKHVDSLEGSVQTIRQRQSTLLDMRLDGKIADEIYFQKNDDLTTQLDNIKRRQASLHQEKEKIEEKLTKMIELSLSLSEAYKAGTRELKSLLLKHILIELLVDREKQLHPKENELFSLLKNLNLPIGTPKGPEL